MELEAISVPSQQKMDISRERMEKGIEQASTSLTSTHPLHVLRALKDCQRAVSALGLYLVFSGSTVKASGASVRLEHLLKHIHARFASYLKSNTREGSPEPLPNHASAESNSCRACGLSPTAVGNALPSSSSSSDSDEVVDLLDRDSGATVPLVYPYRVASASRGPSLARTEREVENEAQMDKLDCHSFREGVHSEFTTPAKLADSSMIERVSKSPSYNAVLHLQQEVFRLNQCLEEEREEKTALRQELFELRMKEAEDPALDEKEVGTPATRVDVAPSHEARSVEEEADKWESENKELREQLAEYEREKEVLLEKMSNLASEIISMSERTELQNQMHEEKIASLEASYNSLLKEAEQKSAVGSPLPPVASSSTQTSGTPALTNAVPAASWERLVRQLELLEWALKHERESHKTEVDQLHQQLQQAKEVEAPAKPANVENDAPPATLETPNALMITSKSLNILQYNDLLARDVEGDPRVLKGLLQKLEEEVNEVQHTIKDFITSQHPLLFPPQELASGGEAGLHSSAMRVGKVDGEQVYALAQGICTRGYPEVLHSLEQTLDRSRDHLRAHQEHYEQMFQEMMAQMVMLRKLKCFVKIFPLPERSTAPSSQYAGHSVSNTELNSLGTMLIACCDFLELIRNSRNASEH